jgi:hypothetical protein
MTPEVANASHDLIIERLDVLLTELRLIRAACKDDSFTEEHVNAWTDRVNAELMELRGWARHLKKEQHDD